MFSQFTKAQSMKYKMWDLLILQHWGGVYHIYLISSIFHKWGKTHILTWSIWVLVLMGPHFCLLTHTHTHCALHVSYLSKHASLLTSILFQNSITPPHISCRWAVAREAFHHALPWTMVPVIGLLEMHMRKEAYCCRQTPNLLIYPKFTDG